MQTERYCSTRHREEQRTLKGCWMLLQLLTYVLSVRTPAKRHAWCKVWVKQAHAHAQSQSRAQPRPLLDSPSAQQQRGCTSPFQIRLAEFGAFFWVALHAKPSLELCEIPRSLPYLSPLLRSLALKQAPSRRWSWCVAAAAGLGHSIQTAPSHASRSPPRLIRCRLSLIGYRRALFVCLAPARR
jgi:hypothetical protein